MNAARVRRRLGWTLVTASLGLHLLTVFAFARQPDLLAAFTVVPIWIWGGFGLLLSCCAFYFLRASLSLIITGIWAITLLLGADEARVLANFSRDLPLPGPAAAHHGQPVIRVITLNSAHNKFGNPADDLVAWAPDVVFVQETTPMDLKAIADALYGGHGDYRFHVTSGIVTRWKIKREVRNPAYRDQQMTVVTPDGREIELVNIHLKSAATDLRLWNPSAWKTHRDARRERNQELATTLQLLEQTSPFPHRPTLLGGDFNSPANDLVHNLLTRDFVDTFAAAGRGWGDTFQRRVPILRLDCIYATRQFTPVRAKVVTTRGSDHRMVVADLIFPD